MIFGTEKQPEKRRSIPTRKIDVTEMPVMQKRRPLWHAMVVVAGAAVVVVSIGAAAYFYHKYQITVRESLQGNELEVIVGQLSKIVELPSGEIPTLATVSDKSKLTEQPFFARTENGDKILLYQQAGKAFLFRPTTGKLINVTSINIQDADSVASDPQTQIQQPPAEGVTGTETKESGVEGEPVAAAAKANIVLYNGTQKTTSALEFERDFLAGNTGVEVLAKGPAAKNDYPETIIVDLTKKFTTLAQDIAQQASISVEALPEGETAPADADILVIVGNK